MKKLISVSLLFGFLFSLMSVPLRAESDDPIRHMTFFGESTTAHLALRGGIDPIRVWSNASGTMRLDSGILSRTVTDRATGQAATVSEMAAAYRPEILVLSFGLNGILSTSERPEPFLRNYRKLTDAVRAVSPETRIVIQSALPVADAAHQNDWKFSVPPAEINCRLTELNSRLRDFCVSDPTLTYVDTATALTDSAGFLRAEFTTDGIHLTASAYAALLGALRQAVNA